MYSPGMGKMPEELKEWLRAEGRKHGAKGGKTRASNLTPEERTEAARAAVNARWAKTPRKKTPKRKKSS
jgi:hypothetical protein